MTDDRAYYLRRAEEHWLAEAVAISDEASAAHAQLAKRYEALANEHSNIVLLHREAENVFDRGVDQIRTDLPYVDKAQSG